MVLDLSCFESLYCQYSERLRNYASHYMKDDVGLAMDIVQESYVRLWESYRGKNAERWHPVLFRIVRNRCLDYLRRKTVMSASCTIGDGVPVCDDALYELDFYFSSSDNQTLYEELSANVDIIIRSLPDKCREVFEMSRFGGLKNKEIAEKLGVSVKTVEKHMTYALKTLRRKLADTGYIDAATCFAILFLLSS